MVCIGQTLLIAGDLNADPAVIPCLAKGISAGRFVDQMLLVNSGGRTVLDLVGTSSWVALMHLLLPRLVRSRIGGSLRIFLFVLAFVSVVGLLRSLAWFFCTSWDYGSGFARGCEG